MNALPFGRAFKLWRENAGDAWERYVGHEFVEQLRDGRLPRSHYLHYLRQDYVFLIHYARAWGLAAAKAGTLDEMKLAAATLHALVNVEMPLHVSTCAAEGLSAADLENEAETLESAAYTRYVLAAGYSGDFLDLMAALAPCVLGYGEIGLRLAGSQTPYAAWIETYSGDAYQGACREVGALIDGALDHRLGPGWDDAPRFKQLNRHFTAATTLEIGFWDMALRGG
jgi:thiaminase (transcriptional activator TenA)